jgi:hypothetical protein
MKSWIAAAAVFVAASAPAQTLAPDVWRCGPEGRSYADRPCLDGRVVAVADDRSAEEVQAAHAVAERERRLADRMVRMREEQARLDSGALARMSAPPAPKAVKPLAAQRRALRQPSSADGIWRAVVPASPRARG